MWDSDGYIYCINFSDGFPYIYIYIYVQLIMHSKCNLLHIDYILIKILK